MMQLSDGAANQIQTGSCALFGRLLNLGFGVRQATFEAVLISLLFGIAVDSFGLLLCVGKHLFNLLSALLQLLPTFTGQIRQVKAS